MNPSDFLTQKLKTRKKYNLTAKDERKISSDLSAFIMDRLFSGKFRKNKADDVTLKNTIKKVTTAVAQKQPIKFTFPFGGYKLHSLVTAPNPDWAEYFTLAYYADYMNQIADYYEPGCEFCFSSDEVIINRMDNIPQKDIDSYTENFKRLVELFNNNLPTNIKFDFVRVRDLYASLEELNSELELHMKDTKDNWDGFSPEKKKDRKTMMLLNINLKGEKDLSGMSEDELETFLRNNTMMHDAYLKLKKRAEFVRGADKIVIFTRPIPDSISIGSTKFSAVKFWSGTGVLGKKEAELQDLILSPSQLERKDFETEKVNLFDIPNFDKIFIYKS